MKTELLNLSHQSLLKPLLRSCETNLSEYSFPNLYLFRHVDHFEVGMVPEIMIKGVGHDGSIHLMPTSFQGFERLLQAPELLEGCDFIFPIPEKWLPSVDTAHWHVSFKEEDSDYLYDCLVMSRYSGRHLSKKRNLVKQFTRSYTAVEKSLDAKTRGEAIDFLGQIESKSDTEPCKEGLERLEELGLEGMAFFVEGRPVGFILGEALPQETFVVHFAKADVSYKGLYQYMMQAFAKKLAGRFRLLNLEEDLGIPSLHQSKHSYHPLQMTPKYRVKYTHSITHKS